MLHITDAHRQVINAGTAYTYTRLSAGTGNRAPDGTETALVTPFDPVREMPNPARGHQRLPAGGGLDRRLHRRYRRVHGQ